MHDNGIGDDAGAAEEQELRAKDHSVLIGLVDAIEPTMRCGD